MEISVFAVRKACGRKEGCDCGSVREGYIPGFDERWRVVFWLRRRSEEEKGRELCLCFWV